MALAIVLDIALAGGVIAICAQARGLLLVRAGAWASVACCGVCGLLLAGPEVSAVQPGGLVLWPGAAFAMMIAGLVGARFNSGIGLLHERPAVLPPPGFGVSGDLALGLCVLAVAADGLATWFGLVCAALLVTQAAPWRSAILLAGGLIAGCGGPRAAWFGASCITAMLAWPGEHPAQTTSGRIRGVVAVASCLAAWHAGAPPLWIAAVGGALVLGGVPVLVSETPDDTIAIADRMAIAQSVLLLGLGSVVRDAGAAWALLSLGWGAWPEGAALWRLACPPMLGGWALWLVLHGSRDIGDPMTRAAFLAVLLASVALGWLACWRASRAVVGPASSGEAWPWRVFSACLCAMPGGVLVLARPLVGGRKSGIGSLVAQDGAVVHPWIVVMAAGAIWFAFWRTGRLRRDDAALMPVRVMGALPPEMLRTLARARLGLSRVLRLSAALVPHRINPIGGRPALLLWLVMLAAGLLWEAGR